MQAPLSLFRTPARWAPRGGPRQVGRPGRQQVPAASCSALSGRPWLLYQHVASQVVLLLSAQQGGPAPSWGRFSWALAGLVARGQRVCWPCVWRLSALCVPPPPTPFSWEEAEVIHSISQSSSLGSEKGRDVFEDLWPLQKRSDLEPGGLRAAAPHGAVRQGPGVGELRTLAFPGQPRRNAEPEPAGPAATRAWSRALRSAAVGEGSGNGRRGRPASGSAHSPELLRGTDVRRASGPRPRACAALPAAPLAWGAAPPEKAAALRREGAFRARSASFDHLGPVFDGENWVGSCWHQHKRGRLVSCVL